VEELGVSKKPWMRDIWARTAALAGLPFDPDGPVWRIEAQVGRAVVAELRVDGGTLDDADSVLRELPSIWRYVTGQWLRLAMPQAGDSNRSRWPTDPGWAELQDAAFGSGASQVRRERVRQGDIDQIVRMLLPLLAHAAALAAPEVVEDTLRAVIVLDDDIERELDRRGVTFRDLVERHRATTTAVAQRRAAHAEEA